MAKRSAESGVRIDALHTFSTVEAARIYLRSRLKSYRESLSKLKSSNSSAKLSLSADDELLFRSVLTKHTPCACEWLQLDSLESMYVRLDSLKNVALYATAKAGRRVMRVDLSKTFESFDHRERQRKLAALMALDYEARDQRAQFCKRFSSSKAQVKCAAHGGLFNSSTTPAFVRYRHPTTLYSLAALFEKDEDGADIDVIPVKNILASEESQVQGAAQKYKNAKRGVWVIEDEELKKAWLDFHDLNADYEIVCQECKTKPPTIARKRAKLDHE